MELVGSNLPPELHSDLTLTKEFVCFNCGKVYEVVYDTSYEENVLEVRYVGFFRQDTILNEE